MNHVLISLYLDWLHEPDHDLLDVFITMRVVDCELDGDSVAKVVEIVLEMDLR